MIGIGIRRHIHLERIAVGEMAERREHVVAVVSSDSANDVANLTGLRVCAFHQGEVPGFGGAKQRLEIAAGIAS